MQTNTTISCIYAQRIMQERKEETKEGKKNDLIDIITACRQIPFWSLGISGEGRKIELWSLGDF